MDDELRQDVKEIKGNVIKLLENSARHNAILEEHQRRSESLELIVIPIRSWMHTTEVIFKWLGRVLGGILTAYVVKKILNK